MKQQSNINLQNTQRAHAAQYKQTTQSKQWAEDLNRHFCMSFNEDRFPGGSAGKEHACNTGDPGSIPGEDSLGKG